MEDELLAFLTQLDRDMNVIAIYLLEIKSRTVLVEKRVKAIERMRAEVAKQLEAEASYHGPG